MLGLGRVQCDQIALFLKDLVSKVSCKSTSPKYVVTFWAIL